MTKPTPANVVVEAALEAWADCGRCSQVPVQGASMWPLLQPGDQALVVHGRQNLHLGDILAYRLGDHVVIHRLLRRQGEAALILGGDNQARLDAPVPAEAVVGRVVAVKTGQQAFSLDTAQARLLGWCLVWCLWARRRGTWRPLSRLTHRFARMLRP